MSSTLNTNVFRITPGCYLRIAASGVLSRIAWCLAILITIFGIASIFDLRFALVLLIILFLIVPFVIFHIYYSQLLTPEAQRMITPKSCIIKQGENIIITYHSANEENKVPATDIIPWNLIKDIRTNHRLLIVTLHTFSSPLIIPLTAFENQDLAIKLVTTDTYSE